MVRIRTTVAAALSVLFLLAAAPAHAQFCSSDRQCGDGRSCQDWFLWIKRCDFDRCNADRDCHGGDTCVNGLCRAPASSAGGASSGGSSGGGSSGGGGGALCGKQTVNGVVHVYPMCARGYQCQEGHCRRLAQ
jgi:hypothetical protein